MTFSGLNETGGDEYRGRDLHARRRDGARSTRRVDAAAVSRACTCCPTAQSFYSGSGTGLAHLRSVDADLDRRSSRPTNYTGTRTYGTSVLLPLSAVERLSRRRS